jgi:hypothetical protein
MEEHPISDLVDRLQYKAGFVDSTVAELLRESSAEIVRLREVLSVVAYAATARVLDRG